MKTIRTYREEIDKIDAAIIKKLAQRIKLVKRIGELKGQKQLKVLDKAREEKLFLRYANLCEQYQLPPKLVKQLFKLIIAYSRGLQR